MKKILGALVALMGLGLATWVAYNLFIDMQPEAEGKKPLIPILLSIGMLYVGVKWMREGAD
jgi:hypothetical protein